MTSWPRRAARDGSTALVAGLVVLVGVWVAGGLVTDDATTAKLLTSGWFAATGAVALLLARSGRVPAVAVLAGWFLTATLTGGYLVVTSTVDRVVDEEVVVAEAAAGPTGAARSAAPTAVLEATGELRSAAHETEGTASLVRTAGGRRLLTLTGFSTAPGPDLRVYAVPRRSGIDGAVDLGRLKGNKGDQQYVVPRTTRVRSVVIWCRAFSVRFGSAVLSPRG